MSEAETSGAIKRSSRSSTRTRRKKKNQVPVGIITGIILAGLAVIISLIDQNLGLFWVTGIIFGFILQKARFCFTASMRDPLLTGSTSVTRAVLIAFAITSIGFWAIKYGAHINGLPIPGQSYVVPVSLATAIGAFMFGIGMVIAGGCASGTLMRVGEGFHMQVLSLLFFIIGSLWGAHDFGWWKLNVISNGKAIFMPDVFGWGGAIVVQLLIIVLLFIAADKWEHRKNEN
ncbi:transporter [Oceanispirochaeta crateris]|uniref:Transporter n=1 Tax=Oceanispirochaeta crateris TaxID=2518645 RepID=A0A5C1QHZ8_9SPIO|nr:YeeE/YedE thiosulfate transporter family protein [Oceanispirochaeta crateris]QEN06908.1 transporter [Oceanispirochaeta crateris]